jgi:organic hydroperoxide reductase OsmC/OhrA
MDNPHEYRVNATWEAGRRGKVSSEGITPAIDFSAPPEFKGDAGFWTPEHFLLAAVASCFVVTFYALADRSRMEFGKLALSVEGKLGTFPSRKSFCNRLSSSCRVKIETALTVCSNARNTDA